MQAPQRRGTRPSMSEEEGPFCLQLRLQCSPSFLAPWPGSGSFIHAEYEWIAVAYGCDGLCLTPERIRFIQTKRSRSVPQNHFCLQTLLCGWRCSLTDSMLNHAEGRNSARAKTFAETLQVDRNGLLRISLNSPQKSLTV